MDQQAAPGWYGTGDGWVAYWDGTQWTGAKAPAPAPPPPVATRRRGLPWPAWVVLIVLFIFVGLPLISAFLQGFSTGLSR